MKEEFEIIPRRKRSNGFHCENDEHLITKSVWSNKKYFNPYKKAILNKKNKVKKEEDYLSLEGRYLEGFDYF